MLGIGLAPGAPMRPIPVVRAFRCAALLAVMVPTVACGASSPNAGDSPEGGTSGSAAGSGSATSGSAASTSGAAAGSSGRTASSGAGATGSTASGSGASPGGQSGSASGATSGGSSGDDGGAQPKTCRTTSDCPSSASPFASIVTCEYALDQGCSAVGSCVTSLNTGPGPACGTLYYGCGCDGTDVYLGCDTSTALTATKPISHRGRCANDGGVE